MDVGYFIFNYQWIIFLTLLIKALKEKECLSTQWDNMNRVFISSTFLQRKSAHKARESNPLRYAILQTFCRHRKEFNSTIIYLFRFRKEQINILQLCRLSRFYLKFSSCRQVVRFLQRGDSWNIRDFKQRRKLAFPSFYMSWRHQICLAKFLNLFTSFCGHRTAQRECARTGLSSRARCHPYTTGVPNSFRIVMWVLLRPARTNQWKCCKTGPTVFRPYPRRLESLTVCRCRYKGSTFLISVI